MEMPYQQLGSIKTPDGELNSMICFDVDRPNEAMVHGWAAVDGANPVAILFDVQWSGSKAKLTPRLRFLPHEVNGEIALRQPTAPEEAAHFFGIRGELVVLKNKSIRGTWTNPKGANGTFKYRAPAPHDARVQATMCKDWAGFKHWATVQRGSQGMALFRGHGDSRFRLTTTLHREGRTRLERYCGETLQQFKAHAEAVLGLPFNLSNGDDYSMLLGLAQHHGLPTPLLDWTDSAYIAAFFAFSDALNSAAVRPGATHVRVYGLSRRFLDTEYQPVVVVPFMRPYVRPLAISARNNPRLYAQQGKFLVTNIADLEHFICTIQNQAGRSDLIAADVPISCAEDALTDLRFMGLTAATMFPGLDGVCRMMRNEMSFRTVPTQVLSKPSGESVT